MPLTNPSLSESILPRLVSIIDLLGSKSLHFEDTHETISSTSKNIKITSRENTNS